MRPAPFFRVAPGSGVPIYRQLVEQVLALSASGKLKAGDFVPSVRQVAEELQINPMTVSKAWSLLEREGVLELVRGQGMRLAAGRPRTPLRARLDELMALMRQAAARARHLDIDPAQAQELLRRAFSEHDHD